MNAFWVAGGICVVAVIAAVAVPYRHRRAALADTRDVAGAVHGAEQPEAIPVPAAR